MAQSSPLVPCLLFHVVFNFLLPPFRFHVYFSSKLNIIDACVVVVTLVVTIVYTFTDLSGASLIPRYLLCSAFQKIGNVQIILYTVGLSY